MKNKCDVIIPVYNAPDWVKLCVYSLFINTPKESLGDVIIMDDNSDSLTQNLLNNLKEKYGDRIKVIRNEKNLGFVKNVNKGLKYSKSDYILLLNSDCLLSKNTIPKLIRHMEQSSQIGLISPVSNNSANVSLEMFEGFSYTKMNSLLERKFEGQNFEACTIVGNCLMISRKCFNKVGNFDEAYGMGYGEETDYQFKAMSKGFEAKIAIDTYVYHKAEASFGNSSQKMKRLEKNRELFFSRWGEEYEKVLSRYSTNDPIEHIKENLEENDSKISVETLFYLPGIVQDAGGCHVVTELVNKFVINGHEANILYDFINGYQEKLLFTPIRNEVNRDIKSKRIISTIWSSTFQAYEIAKKLKIPLVNFVQGYENYFTNGSNYRSVELTHKMADYEITISKYLQEKIKEIFNTESYLVRNGINYDLARKVNIRKKVKNIAFVLRNNVMKGDYILLDIMKELDNRVSGLNINVVLMNKDSELPSLVNNTMNITYGPIANYKMIEFLQENDVYVDASVNEGFGLIGLEAIACGAVPVMSNSFGILDYMEDSVTGYIIKDINNSKSYVEKILALVDNHQKWSEFKEYNQQLVKNFDYEESLVEFIKIFNKEKALITKSHTFTKEEVKLIKKYKRPEEKPLHVSKGLSFVRRINHHLPKFVRKLLKKFGNWFYHLYNHN